MQHEFIINFINKLPLDVVINHILPYTYCLQPKKLLLDVRSFYNDLLIKILNEFNFYKDIALLGNSGIGTSAFQWYIIYRLYKDRDSHSLPLSPKLIIR